MVGADFTPSSMPPALRMRLFATHLREFGWEPIVITTKPEFYEWQVDPENQCLLPDDIEIIRTAAISAGVTRKIGIGDVGIRSLWYHWRELSKLCRTGGIDLIFLPVPPWVPMVLGRIAKIRFGVPYVIDYIDPWVSEYYWTLPSSERPPKWAMAYALSRVLEPFAIRKVSHIVGVSSGTTDSVISRYRRLTRSDATDIPYGGEPDDINYIRAHPRQNPIFQTDDGFCHISYVGACTPGMFRTIDVLFKAVALGLKRAPELFSRLRLHFVGGTYDPHASRISPLLRLAKESGISEVVDEHPKRVPYLTALQILLDSHALLVIGYEEAHYTASKIYPYILAQRPILALLNESSSSVAILIELHAAQVVTFGPDNPLTGKLSEIVDSLEEILSYPSGYVPATNWKAFEPYTARAMTRRLAGAFEKALAAGEVKV